MGRFGVDGDSIRSIGKKVLGIAAGGLFLGSIVQLGFSDTDGGGGDALVDHLAQSQDDPGAETVDNPLYTDDPDDVSNTTSSGTIDYHRLNC